ncbi:MAG: purine-nucleoside phosphorylase [Bdellovibrionales bacterium]
MIYENLKKSVAFIRAKTDFTPDISVTLGSGLGHFAQAVDVVCSIEYKDIPGFIPPSVEGHGGKLILGHLAGKKVALLQGRVHYYEGHSMAEVIHPTRVVGMLGAKVVIITNSAGGLNKEIEPGTFMILRDQVNMTGENPLRGPNISELGVRFPDMSEPFDTALSDQLEEVLKSQNVPYFNGVYFGVQGPTYETAAEVKLYGDMGGGAVGMSTVPEVIAAKHMGRRVVGVSCITNLGTGLSQVALTHEDVKEVAARVENQFSQFLSKFIGDIK